jgi:hypothetical protein
MLVNSAVALAQIIRAERDAGHPPLIRERSNPLTFILSPARQGIGDKEAFSACAAMKFFNTQRQSCLTDFSLPR